MKEQDLLLGELREFKRHALREIGELRADVKDLNRTRHIVEGAFTGAILVALLAYLLGAFK